MSEARPVIVFIEARANSVRLPGKHSMDIGGKPLIQYPMEYAQECEQVDHVVLTTNCDQCKYVAEQLDIGIHHRPDHLAEEGMEGGQWFLEMEAEYIKWAKANLGIDQGVYVRLMGNSIILNKYILSDCIKKLLSLSEKGVPVAATRPVSPIRDHPARNLILKDDGEYRWVSLPDEQRADCPDGASSRHYDKIYVLTDGGFVVHPFPRRQGPGYGIWCDPHDILHIHTLGDFEIARAVLKAKELRTPQEALMV